MKVAVLALLAAAIFGVVSGLVSLSSHRDRTSSAEAAIAVEAQIEPRKYPPSPVGGYIPISKPQTPQRPTESGKFQQSASFSHSMTDPVFDREAKPVTAAPPIPKASEGMTNSSTGQPLPQIFRGGLTRPLKHHRVRGSE